VAARRFKRGTTLGKYRLERRIGRGALGTVWRARDTVEDRAVALKVVSPDRVQEHGRNAIEHEARVATRLSHPNVVSVRNADWVDGHFVMASDLAVSSLADYAGARRSGELALSIIRQIAAGLAYAHEQRVLHRDVKPENILIFKDRHAALCDFDVARLTTGRTVAYTDAGTLGYIAPEQAYGRTKLASDVFSLGLIAYELLTGVLPTWPFAWPFIGHERFERKVPAPVQPVLRKAAAFDPQRRYANAVVFHEALEAAFKRAANPPPQKRAVRRRLSAPVRTPLEVQAEAFRRQHGAALGMRYQCFRCEGPISESMAVCPWCGTRDNSFRDITSYPLVCPDCEHGVKAEWTACPWCSRGRLAGNGRPPRKDPKAERTCAKPGCDGQLQSFMRYCPRCKQKTKRLWSHLHLPHRCKRCRWPVSRSFWRFCPWCGRKEPEAGAYGS
jgi:serine/threonine-protein kinase